MKKKVFSICLATIFMMVCVNGTLAAEKKKDLKFVKFVSSSPGGTWYPPGVAITSIIAKNLKGVSTRITPGGSAANVKSVGSGQAELGFCHAAIAGAAYKGVVPYKKKYSDLRYLFSTTPAGIHFAVNKKSDIKSIGDLKDKRIGMAPKGYLANTIAEQLFSTYGFTLEDVKKAGGTISYLGLKEGPQSLVDGHIDVYLGVGAWPYTPYLSVDFNPGVRFLSIEDDVRDAFLEKYSWYSPITIPKETYNSLSEDLQTVGSYVSIVTNATLPDDAVYQITKAIWENLDEIHKVSPVDKKWMRLKTALKGATIPVHPGAMKYYNEKGVKVEK